MTINTFNPINPLNLRFEAPLTVDQFIWNHIHASMMRTRKAPIEAPINPINESNTGIPLHPRRLSVLIRLREKKEERRGERMGKKAFRKWGKIKGTYAASTNAAIEQPPTQENQTR